MNKLDISLVVCVADDIRIEKFLNSINYYCEIIIVLNGSTNEVRKIVTKFNNQNKFDLKIIEIKEKNLGKARNLGIVKAKHDKVVFYDSDCIIVGDALKLYSKYLEKYMLVDGTVKFENNTFQSKIVSIIRSMGIPGYALCPSIGINKKIKSKINNYFFDKDIKWIEDAELNQRAKQASIEIGVIKELTCIHDKLTFKQDLKSAYRYGTGVKIASKKGLLAKRPDANWNLIIPSFKKNFMAGIYCIIWNVIYCLGYYTKI